MPDPSPLYGRFTAERNAGVATFCATCRSLHRLERGDELETWGCMDDACHRRLCSECVRECFGCRAKVCESCLTDIAGELTCRVCINAMVADAERELAEELEVANG